MSSISFDDFLKVDVRLGQVLTAVPFPEARKPAYKMTIDFGPEIGVKQTSAQVTDLYTPDALVGMHVLAVVNFAPKRIAGFKSEVLVLGVHDEQNHVSLVSPQHSHLPLGARLL